MHFLIFFFLLYDDYSQNVKFTSKDRGGKGEKVMAQGGIKGRCQMG